MAVSDRIAVMNAGEIQQIGTPKILYQRPANLFVATFIGHTNVIDAKLKEKDGEGWLVLPGGYEVKVETLRKEEIYDRDVKASIRPEELVVDADNKEGVEATIDDAIFLGLNTHYFVRLEDGTEAEVIQESQIEKILEPGENLFLTVNTRKVNVFDAETGLSLMTGIEDDMER